MAASQLEPKQLVLSRGNSICSEASYKSRCTPQNGRKSFAGGTLLPEKEVWRIFADMARAIKHVHDKEFIHLDIKPSNFFVAKDGKVKLGDFGLAIDLSKLDEMIDDDQCGDATYMAPELLQHSHSLKQKMTKKADIFSLGATLLEIASSMNLP